MEKIIALSNNYTMVTQIQMTFILAGIELLSQLNGIINSFNKLVAAAKSVEIWMR